MKKIIKKKTQATEKADKVQVYPQGLAVTSNDLTSFVLFKDKAEKLSFPIWYPYVPMGIASDKVSLNLKTPYQLSYEIIQFLSFDIKECIFDEVNKDQQKASLILENKMSQEIFKMKMNAYEAVSICSTNKETPFFADIDFIAKTRDVELLEKVSRKNSLPLDGFRKSGQKYLM